MPRSLIFYYIVFSLSLPALHLTKLCFDWAPWASTQSTVESKLSCVSQNGCCYCCLCTCVGTTFNSSVLLIYCYFQEKKGPKIAGELLQPRGEEGPKFLNSMQWGHFLFLTWDQHRDQTTLPGGRLLFTVLCRRNTFYTWSPSVCFFCKFYDFMWWFSY